MRHCPLFSGYLLTASGISYQDTSSLEFPLSEGGFGVHFNRMFLFVAHKAIS